MSNNGKGRRPPLVADKRYQKPKPAAAKTKRASTAARTPRRRPQRRRGPIGLVTALFALILRAIWGLTWRSAAVLALIVAVAVFYFYSTMPPLDQMLDARIRGSVTMLDRDDRVFAWRGEQYGGQITAKSVSPNLKNAIVATEDKRFYRHFGVSPRGIAGAIRINLAAGRGPFSGNGGSTITQQVAKLVCIGVPYDAAKWKTQTDYEADCRASSLWRKMKEAVFAMALEAKFSKDQILTIYLNRAYLGAGAQGFEAASQRYFGKSAADVSPAEGALLAGLLTAPSYYAPTNNLKRSQERANIIIGLEEDQGYLTHAQAEDARKHPAVLSEAAEAQAGGYYADWVMDTGPSFLTRDTTEDVDLYTTFDPRIQQAAEDALVQVFDDKVKDGSEAQAAIVVMSPDGAVRAMVGGRKFTGVAGQFNRAIMAKRQTGSSFKPFVYAAALDQGFSPYATVEDEPLTIDIPGSGPWSPQNYCHCFKGTMTLADALKESENIPAIKVSRTAGLDNVRKVASDFGIESDLASGPALALGVSESTLLEMTGAYAGILNGGTSVKPYGLRQLRIKGENSALMDQQGGLGERVVAEGAARQLIWMMSRVIDEGTGRRAKLPDREAAGKTGTTQASRDAWFMGFTADYVVGVWMGYDDNRPLKGVTGGGLPADIWRETMVRIDEGIPPSPLPMEVPVHVSDNGSYMQEPSRQGGDDQADRVLIDVLGRLFGRRD